MITNVKIFKDVNNKKDIIGTYKLILILEKYEPTNYCLGVFDVNNKMMQYYFDLNDVVYQKEDSDEGKNILL
jgi:hypothetical protein